MIRKQHLAIALLLSSGNLYADNWNGPYIGASLGYADVHDKGERPLFPEWTNDITPESNTLDFYAGYNWKIASKVVLSLEASYSDRGNLTAYNSLKNNGVYDDYYGLTTKVSNVISVQARLGRLFNNDQSLAYLLLGRTKADVERVWLDDPDSPSLERFTDTQSGWTAGLGLEHALTENLSLKVEAKYSDYGREEMDVDLWGEKWSQELTEKTINFGISYRF